MTATALESLVSQGAAGALAALLAIALGYTVRRFIAHLERAEERQATLAAAHAEHLQGLSRSLLEASAEGALRHEELTGRVRGIEREVRFAVEASQSSASAAAAAAEAAREAAREARAGRLSAGR